VHELFNQLFTTLFGVTATAVVTTATATITATTATVITATATTAATTTFGLLRRCGSSFNSGGFAALDFCFVSHLELQSAFASSVGKRLDTAMKQEATAVENDLGDASLLSTLGNSLTHQDSRVEIGSRLGAGVLFDG
jgi:hypothetical protein